jgi:hypothetical protein
VGAKVVTLFKKDDDRLAAQKIQERQTNLSLEKVSRHDLTPVAIEKGKSCAESRCGYTPEDSLSNDTPPAGLCFVNGCSSKARVSMGEIC